MSLLPIIETRRDGKPHPAEQLRELASAAAQGDPNLHYQLSAWLMAAYLNPLSDEDTQTLTLAMADSGERLDLSGLPKPWLDKHSTGGVGDKTSMAVLPILAAAGLSIVKMSGKGLGVTGGTIDKLSSIPGFRLDLSPQEMLAQARAIGIVLNGQTADLAPADKTLYMLRDTTGTVENLPLIVSSILSKKLAGGADHLVLDVKSGSGGFCPDFKTAETLASQLVRTSRACGLPAIATITDMTQPLGSAVGNALEVREAFETLRGVRETRFSQLVRHFAAEALVFCGVCSGTKAAESKVNDILESGQALSKADEWVRAQSGLGVAEALERLPKAPFTKTICAPQKGYVAEVHARSLGLAVIELGGGRKLKTDTIDPAVGMEVHVTVGDAVSAGDPLVTVHARTSAEAEAVTSQVEHAVMIQDGEVEPRPLILATLGS